MFKEWGFLLAEIWVLLALMAVIGLLAGWLIWGGGHDRDTSIDLLVAKDDELKRLRAELAQEKARVASRPEPETQGAVVLDAKDANVSEVSVGVKPKGRDGARDGISDDLKLIKGVGREMEILCNSLGYYHFDQIAAWSPDEVTWVDDNLDGFKGRVTRDGWVAQAQALSTGKPMI